MSASKQPPQAAAEMAAMQQLHEKQRELEGTLASLSQRWLTQPSISADIDSFKAHMSRAVNEMNEAQTKERKLFDHQRQVLSQQINRPQIVSPLQPGESDKLVISKKVLEETLEKASRNHDSLVSELEAREAEVGQLKAELARLRQSPQVANTAWPNARGNMSSIPTASIKQAAEDFDKLQDDLHKTEGDLAQARRNAEGYRQESEQATLLLGTVKLSWHTAESVSAEFRKVTEHMVEFCRSALQINKDAVGGDDEQRQYHLVSRDWQKYISNPDLSPFFFTALIWRQIYFEIIPLGAGVWGADIKNTLMTFYQWLQNLPQGGDMDEETLDHIKRHINGTLDGYLTAQPELVNRISEKIWGMLISHIPGDKMDVASDHMKQMVQRACKLSVMAELAGAQMAYPARAFEQSVNMPLDNSCMESVKSVRADGNVDLYIAPAVTFPHGGLMIKAYVVT
ncbi:hypothetical protein PG988_011910 [Apiospora saccharicola]